MFKNQEIKGYGVYFESTEKKILLGPDVCCHCFDSQQCLGQLQGGRLILL